jgi:DNA-binding cell septation regulator SpoVG
MHITVELHEKTFNVCLASKEGKEPFLVVKGCRVVNGQKGRFVSGPATKMDTGKFFNYSYMSESFQQAVLKAYDDSTPTTIRAAPVDSDIPF